MENMVTTGINILRILDGGKIEKQEINSLFGEEDLKLVNLLYKDGSIIDIFDETNKKTIITLTNKGKFVLFIEDNRTDIFSFGSYLESFGLDTSHLYSYLEGCYSPFNYLKIFSIDNYERFLDNLDSNKTLLRKY